MTVYCGLPDLIDRYGEAELSQLSDRVGIGMVDQAVVELAIADADGEIDGYVAAAGYPLPLAPVPGILTAYACDMARYRLMADQATDQVRRRYEDAIKFLKALAAGQVRLDARLPDPAAGGAEYVQGAPVFDLRGY